MLQCLCVLDAEFVSMYMPNGETHTISTPCKALGLWPLPRGMLIEIAEPGALRPPSPPQTALSLLPGVVHACMRGAEDTTAAFMLMQPLDDYKPLVLAGGDSPMEDLDAAAVPQHHRGLGTVLLSDRQQPLVLSHDTTRQAHTLWAVRGEAEWQASACWEQESGSGGAAASSFIFVGEGGGVTLCLLQAERQSLAIHHLAPTANGGALGAVAPTVTIAAVAAQPVAATLPTHGHAYAAVEAAGWEWISETMMPDRRLLGFGRSKLRCSGVGKKTSSVAWLVVVPKALVIATS